MVHRLRARNSGALVRLSSLLAARRAPLDGAALLSKTATANTDTLPGAHTRARTLARAPLARCPDANRHTEALIVARVVSGIGEASFQCIAPCFIDDAAPTHVKGKVLAAFFMAVPIGQVCV